MLPILGGLRRHRSSREKQLSKTARNERAKHAASFFNSIAVTMIATGFIIPAFTFFIGRMRLEKFDGILDFWMKDNKLLFEFISTVEFTYGLMLIGMGIIFHLIGKEQLRDLID